MDNPSVVRLRSADGEVFEVSEEAARLSALVQDMLDTCDGDDCEIPLPMVNSDGLRRVIDQCKGRVREGMWDLKRLGSTEEELEEMLWVSDYLNIERLMGLCLAKLAVIISGKTVSQVSISTRAMRRVLSYRMNLTPENLASVVLALGAHALRGDTDALHAVCLHMDDERVRVQQAVLHAAGVLAPRGCQMVTSFALHRSAEPHKEIRHAAIRCLGNVGAWSDKRITEFIVRKSQDWDPGTRCAAVEALGRMVRRGQARTLAAVVARLEDSVAVVRKAAVEAHALLAEHGDARSVQAIARKLEDPDEGVRTAAVETLGQIATRGDPEAVSAIGARLEHRFWWVAKAAVKALGQVAEKGTRTAVDAVVARLSHPDAAVRRVAFEALPVVISDGDPRVMKLVSDLLDHHATVRSIASQALLRIGKGSERALMTCTARLEDADERVRHAAVDAMCQHVPPGDSGALREVMAGLDDATSRVRHAAVVALRHLGHKGDGTLVRTLSKRFSDSVKAVRFSAASVCEEMEETGDHVTVQHLLASLESGDEPQGQVEAWALVHAARPKGRGVKSLMGQRLRHRDPRSKRSAREAIRQLTVDPGVVVLDATRACIHGTDSRTRLAALEAIEHEAPPGDAEALEVVASLMSDRDHQVRLAAIHSLARMAADRNSAVAVRCVAKAIADPAEEVREAALRALPVVGKRNDDQAIQAASVHLQDSNWYVRWAALGALASLADPGHPCAIKYVALLLDHELLRVRDVAQYALTNLLGVGAGQSPPAVTAAASMAPAVDPRELQANVSNGHSSEALLESVNRTDFPPQKRMRN